MAFNPNQPRDSHGRFGEVANAISELVASIGPAHHVANALANVLKHGSSALNLGNYRRITKNFGKEITGLFERSLGGHQLTQEEKHAISVYSAEDHDLLNGHLRSNLEPDRLIGGNLHVDDEDLIDTMKAGLDSAMAKSKLPEDLFLFRGIRGSVVAQHKVGEIVTDHGYTSTTISRDVAEAFGGLFSRDSAIVHILARKGSSALPLNGYSDNEEEHEVLLARGSRYRVLHSQPRHEGSGLDIIAELL